MSYLPSNWIYCNSIYVGVSQASLMTAVISGCFGKSFNTNKKSMTISPLCWHPVHFKTDFKVLLMTYKALNGQAHVLLSDLMQPYVSFRCILSNDHLLLIVQRSRLVDRGYMAFSVVAPNLWNQLHLFVSLASNTGVCQFHLKTH